MEFAALGLGERGQEARLGRVQHPLDLPRRALSAGGNAHDLPTAVAFIAFPDGQPLRLEAVDERHDVAAVDAKAERDVLLTGGPVLVEAAQDGVLVLTQPGGG